MKDIQELVDTYAKTAVLNRISHYRAANDALRKHYWLGIPAIIISTAVGTSIFASLSNNPSDQVKILIGLVSFLGAALSSLQTLFKFSEVAEKHRVAGAAYGSVKRNLDILKLKYSSEQPPSREEALKEIEQVSKILGDLAKDSPGIPDKAFQEAKKIESEQKA